MATWTQYTYVNGELKYEPKVRTADDMVQLLAQMHFLKQSGEDLEVGIESTDDMYRVTCYTVHRHLTDREVFQKFVKN